MTRTQADIVDRIEAIAAEDLWGFRRDVLIDSLDYANAKKYIKDDVTEDQWSGRSAAIGNVDQAVRDYLAFAIGKIEDHRGMSARRSVSKLTEYAWLLGRDDIVEAMDKADYPQYGAPKVKAFATGMGFDVPDSNEFERMTEGRFCNPNCNRGCGQ